jgi:hypothetical protein
MLRWIDAACIPGAASIAVSGVSCSDGDTMIRVHPAPADDDVPDDPAMRLIEVGIAILALIAAGILTLIR